MALPLPIRHTEPTSIRRHVGITTRLPVELPGRVMFSDRVEMPCLAVSISNLEFEAVSPKAGAIGERVVCYFEDIQRVEGEITQISEGGFVARIVTPPGSRDKTAARIRWALEKGTRKDNREAVRIEPVHKSVELKIGEDIVKSRLIDVSVNGAAVVTSQRPEVGSSVTVGHTRANVVRHTDLGIAVKFVVPLPIGSFDENVIL